MIITILIISICTYLGEILTQILPLPIPGSIYGFFLLFISLYSKLIPLKKIEKTSTFIIQNMSLLFIPITLKLTQTFTQIQGQFIVIMILVILTTIITMVSSGKAANMLLGDDQ